MADILGIIQASAALIPALYQADKLEEAEQALTSLVPMVDDLKAFSPQTIVNLHSEGKLEPLGAAIATLVDVVGAVLDEDPNNGPHVVTLLTALGLPTVKKAALAPETEHGT